MFLAVKNDTGSVQPWEYLDADPGEYKVGQPLELDGNLRNFYGSVADAPQYLCMTNEHIPEGETKVIPVVRVTGDTIFETQCDTAGLVPGYRYALSPDGVVKKDTEGAFEITQILDGAVRGRFVPVGQAATAAAANAESE